MVQYRCVIACLLSGVIAKFSASPEGLKLPAAVSMKLP